MVLFRDAVSMREQSPALARRLIPSGSNPVWNLADLTTGSFFRPLSREKRKKGSGPRPSCALCDEVHEHPDELIIETLERGFKFRRQPLLVMTTNSGSDPNTVCGQEHAHAVAVAAGTLDPGSDFAFIGEPINDDCFSYVCALDPGDDPLTDPTCWIKANPLLGTTLTEEYLAGVVRQAKQLPGKRNGILRLHFCVWTEADEAWMARETLEAVLDDFEVDEYEGEDAVLAVDLSAAQDLTAIAVVVRDGFTTITRKNPDTGKTEKKSLPKFAAWVLVFTPEDTLAERARRDKRPYPVWVEQGFLTALPGKMIRLDFVAAAIQHECAEVAVESLAYDRYSYAKLEAELDELGVEVEQVEHPQGGIRRAKESGLWMPGSVKALEELILEKRIRIKRNPCVVAAMMSAAVEHDPFDNRWFSKRRAISRIDPLVALTMAVGQATATDTGDSVYEERGLLTF